MSKLNAIKQIHQLNREAVTALGVLIENNYKMVASVLSDSGTPAPAGYLGATAAAEYMGMPIGTLRQITSKNQIRFYKPTGGRVYYKKSDLDEFMESGLVPTNKELLGEVS